MAKAKKKSRFRGGLWDVYRDPAARAAFFAGAVPQEDRLWELLRDPVKRQAPIGEWMKLYPRSEPCRLGASQVRELTRLLPKCGAAARADAAFRIAWQADDLSIPGTLAALGDADMHVRQMAIGGVSRGCRDHVSTPKYRAATFAALAARLEGQETFGIAPALVAVDRVGAVPLLLDKLKSGGSAVADILGSLDRAGVLIPAETAISLLERLNWRKVDGADEYACGRALVALAKTRDPRAESIMKVALRKPRLTTHAARAMAAYVGVGDAWRFVSEEIKKRGFGDLKKTQQLYWSVGLLVGEVGNGGFSQYFFNSAGDHARAAASGLRRLGMDAQAVTMRNAMAAFGRSGPSPDRKKRQAQLTRLSDKPFGIWEKCDRALMKQLDPMRTKLDLFAAEHASDFGAECPRK